MPSRWRVTVYLPEEMLQALEQWATDENRSTSNLAATILIGAIKEHVQQQLPAPEPLPKPNPPAKGSSNKRRGKGEG